MIYSTHPGPRRRRACPAHLPRSVHVHHDCRHESDQACGRRFCYRRQSGRDSGRGGQVVSGRRSFDRRVFTPWPVHGHRRPMPTHGCLVGQRISRRRGRRHLSLACLAVLCAATASGPTTRGWQSTRLTSAFEGDEIQVRPCPRSPSTPLRVREPIRWCPGQRPVLFHETLARCPSHVHSGLFGRLHLDRDRLIDLHLHAGPLFHRHLLIELGRMQPAGVDIE